MLKLEQNNLKHAPSKGQTAIEYMLLLGVVVAIVLVAFKTLLPNRVQTSANLFFNRTAVGIMGKQNPCGDGICQIPFENSDSCCTDCPPGCPNF